MDHETIKYLHPICPMLNRKKEEIPKTKGGKVHFNLNKIVCIKYLNNFYLFSAEKKNKENPFEIIK